MAMELNELVGALRGISPRAWLCVRDGYSREEVKDQLVRRAGGIAGATVCSLEELAARVLGARPDRILRPDARREVLRTLLKSRAIAHRVPEIWRKSQGSRKHRFLLRLDRALAQGRLCFAHQDEWAAQEEHLRLTRGERALRTEIRLVSLAYEAWLEAEDRWDLPRLLAEATRGLREGNSGEGLPAQVFRLGVSKPEPREAMFWEAIGSTLELTDLDPAELSEACAPAQTEHSFALWHSVDDASHAAAEAWIEDRSGIFLIPDSSEMRRSLRLGLGAFGAGFKDPRDPMAIASDESLKLGLLPLRVVTSGFDRADTTAYLRHCARVGRFEEAELEAWGFECADGGWTGGLGGALRARTPNISKVLSQLDRDLSRRRSTAELERWHLEELAALKLPSAPFDRHWVRLRENLALVGQADRRIRAREALERLDLLIEESPAASDGFYDSLGADVYRAQVPVPLGIDVSDRPVTLLGLGAGWLDEGATGDLWYSEADREALREFGIAGRDEVRARRKWALETWLKSACRVRWIDYEYEATGREREKAYRLWSELGERGLDAELPSLGAHPRWLASFAGPAISSHREIRLPSESVPGVRPQFSATALENASRCPAIHLVRDRWKLRDLEEAGPEIQAAARGNVLHEAVRTLLRARSPDGVIGITVRDALDQAMKTVRLRGLMRGERVARVARARLIPILEKFLEDEAQYFARVGARPISLDERELVYETEAAKVRGKPDRIDETQDGLFIMDYKSSTANPTGAEMLENGYRLQLPLYALAAEQELKRPVLALQFIPLARAARRSNGVFFAESNGKEPGKLTTARSNSRSLINGDRAETWRDFAVTIDQTLGRMIEGDYSARPPLSKECERCRFADLCGEHRAEAMGEPPLGGGGDAEGEGGDEA